MMFSYIKKEKKIIKNNLLKNSHVFFGLHKNNHQLHLVKSLHISRILTEYDNYEKSFESKTNILKNIMISHLKNENKNLNCTQSHVFTGRKISPENMFSGVVTRSDVAVKNYDHFVCNEDGRLKGTSLLSKVALGFCGYDFADHEEAYVYKLNYPLIFIFGPDVFLRHKLNNDNVFDEKEVASCVGFPGEDICNVTKYKLNQLDFNETGIIDNSHYKRRDFAIQITTTYMDEHDDVNKVYLKNKKISSKYTGINIERAESLEHYINQLDLSQHKKLTSRNLIIDAMPSDMNHSDQNKLIDLFFNLKNQILSEHFDDVEESFKAKSNQQF